MAKVLIACECSGTVRESFKKLGHNAWSCDLKPTEIIGNHYQGDIKDILYDKWDLIIAHPPCTYFSNAGARWYYHPKYMDDRINKRNEALEFFKLFSDHKCDFIAIENPIGSLSNLYKKPTQIIQPFEFGHTTSKATCLWLKGLPKLTPTNLVDVEWHYTPNGKKFTKWYYESSIMPLSQRATFRSRTFQGIADAMANQWGGVI